MESALGHKKVKNVSLLVIYLKVGDIYFWELGLWTGVLVQIVHDLLFTWANVFLGHLRRYWTGIKLSLSSFVALSRMPHTDNFCLKSSHLSQFVLHQHQQSRKKVFFLKKSKDNKVNPNLYLSQQCTYVILYKLYYLTMWRRFKNGIPKKNLIGRNQWVAWCHLEGSWFKPPGAFNKIN